MSALAGIPDPAALVASHRQLVEALDGLLAPLGPGGYVLPAGAVKTARAQAALAAARSVMGEG